MPHDGLASMPFVLQRFRYILTGLYAIQVYDWLLTLGDEVALIQQAPWTSAKLGYFICRYYPLWAMPVSMYAWLPNHERSLCVRLLHPSHIILIPLQLCPQAVMLMRAYAFTGRKKAVLVALLPCYALLAGLDIWGLSTGLILSEHLFAQLGRTSCVSDHGGGALASRMGAIMASAVLMDLVSLVVVVSHALRIRSFQGHLGKIFIRQGQCIFSFAIALSANLVAAIIYFGIPSSRYDGSALPFSLVFTNLTAARMILSLRRQVSPTETQITRQHSMLVRHALATDKPDHWTIH
ncbi:hypothetical protein ONZ45_g5343 [Pleurotus djamor]|nr:hypothetical protein ONZ45_g5343 [Pleurotus djamor]